MEIAGTIFNIQHFSISDGPGIRTTVFLKGCPLRCKWCHNPESWANSPQLGYVVSKCIGCGSCIQVCPVGAHRMNDGKHGFDREKCVQCGKCVEVCSGALEWIGNKINCKDVIADIERDALFYKNSGGGVTLSGGEPLMQYKFCKELLIECKKRNIHTAVETSGYVSGHILDELAPYIALFLYDWKESDTEKHRLFTGKNNELIKNNLIKLDKMSKHIVLRCPIIPNYNFTKEHRDGIINISLQLKNLREINIEPYHPLGAAKADIIGGDYMAANAYVPDIDELKIFSDYIYEKTRVPVKIM